MPVTHKPTEVPVALQKCMGMARLKAINTLSIYYIKLCMKFILWRDFYNEFNSYFSLQYEFHPFYVVTVHYVKHKILKPIEADSDFFTNLELILRLTRHNQLDQLMFLKKSYNHKQKNKNR